MNFVLTLAPLLFSLFPVSSIERAFTLLRNSEWAGAAAALDEAHAENPAFFGANNFHYLRGRVAENQRDWARARQEFLKIEPGNPLYELATWHAARASANLRDGASAKLSIEKLPRDFPASMKMQVARESGPPLASEIYSEIVSREARLELAKLNGDNSALWSLLNAEQTDDAALQAAHILARSARTEREQLTIADTFLAHRQFEYAMPLYEALTAASGEAANARFQIARIHYLREDYQRAIDAFSQLVRNLPGTDWEKDSDYQIASCYWRLGDFRAAEKSYLRYISKYGRTGQYEGAVRNLVDVYRALGEEQKALTWIDRLLAGRLTASGRQVLLFTKAKILYTQKRYTAAQNLFGQLAAARLRAAAGNTTREEAKYLQALSLSKAGNKAAADRIWHSLAQQAGSYYSLKAAEQLGKPAQDAAAGVCQMKANLPSIEERLERLRRPFLTEPAVKRDAVTELAFLRLWDEASLWFERRDRPDPRTAAELAYAAGRYHRSIVYADRLPKSDAGALALLYPAGYRELICDASRNYNVDALWLHAIIWQESKYNPRARSSASARGLMQFIPETASAVGTAMGMPEFSLDKLYEPAVNIPMGAYHWSSLLGQLKHPVMALAAYNGGPNNVLRWLAKWPSAPAEDHELFVADIGFLETKRYVMAVFAARAAYASLAN